jgi:type IV pilus assembly protein PilE
MHAKKADGFTLIELMIVVAVIAILAAFAYYNYSRYGFRARRADAKNLLMNISAAEERYYTAFNKYTSSITGAAPTGLGFGSANSENGYYSAGVTLTSVDQGFTLTATPVSGRPQAADQCSKLTLKSSGEKGFSGNESNGKCW